MAEPQTVVTGLAKLAVTVKEKADQAEANQVTCKLLVSVSLKFSPGTRSFHET